MDDHTAGHGAKHLLSVEELASSATTSHEQLTRGHRPGNGLRVHRVYFFVVSLAALVVLMAFIAIASSTMT